MRTVRFILKLGLKILAAPVVLALMLFTWVCFGLLYVSS
ncbi:succinate dehydrogenase, partial [Gemmiger formicilis]|nr:succinate dehydrogenase [Gemmiger formicilis]